MWLNKANGITMIEYEAGFPDIGLLLGYRSHCWLFTVLKYLFYVGYTQWWAQLTKKLASITANPLTEKLASITNLVEANDNR